MEAEAEEWVVRYPEGPEAALELAPLSVRAAAPALLWDAAEFVVLSSAYLGRREVLAECFGIPEASTRAFASASPFPLDQRRIVHRPVGALSRSTLPALEPALGQAVAGILARHPSEKGLIHAASYASARRLVRDLATRAPADFARLIFVESADAKVRAL